jgi:hypothetical protein
MARTAITLWAAAGFLAAANAALAAPFAMITDLKGDAWALEGDKPRKLSLLGYIESPTEVKVDPAAKLAITYFASGLQYNFAGPARVALDSAAPKVIDGQAADAKKVTPEKSIGGGLSSDQWRRLQQATVVMRAVRSNFSVVGPDRTALLVREPEFEWTAAAGARGYRLVVYGPDNNILHEATTDQNSLTPALELQPGKRYRWKVDALGVTKPVSANGAFTIADDAERARMSEVKRAAGSELGARSFYATTLEAEGHQHDARAEWKALAREYPNEPDIVQRSR